MTPEKVMALVDDHADAATAYYRGCPGTLGEHIKNVIKARAAVEAALRYAPQQAEGWVMVPVEPSVVMLEQGKQALYEDSMGDFDATLLEIKATYRAMLAARPSAPTAVEPTAEKASVVELVRNCRHCGGPDDVICAGQCRASKGTK